MRRVREARDETFDEMTRLTVSTALADDLRGDTAPFRDRPEGSAEQTWSTAVILVLGLSLFAAATWPLVEFPLLGLQDYPNHLARGWVLTHLDDPVIGAQFRSEWRFLPDLVFDVWMVVLGPAIGVFAAGRCFVGVSMFLTVAGVAALAWAMRGSVRVPQLIVVPILFNYGFRTGLLAFDMAMGTMLLAAAVWERLRAGRRTLRLGVGALFCLLLQSMHVVGLGAYGLWVVGARLRDLSALRTPGAVRRRLSDGLVDGVQVLPVVVMTLWSGFGATDVAAAPIPRGFEWPWDRVVQLQRLIDIGPTALNVAVAAMVALPVVIGLLTGRLAIDRRVGPAVVAAFVLFFVLPDSLGDAHQIAWRALLIAALFLAAGLEPRPGFGVKTASSFVAIFAAAVVTATVVTARDWSGVERAHRDMMAALAEVPAGARLFYVQTDAPKDRDERRAAVGLYHLPSFATIERRMVVFSTFVIPGQHPLRFRDPALQMFPRKSMTYARDIRRSVEKLGGDLTAVLDRMDFVLARGTGDAAALAALGGRELVPRARVGDFTLFVPRSRPSDSSARPRRSDPIPTIEPPS